MPVPAFNGDGVLPPYIGANGPGGAFADMSPYLVTCLEVVQTLGTTPHRRNILVGWLQHRSALANAGFLVGSQWLDGSFLENKVPNDLDLVTLFERPVGFQQNPAAFVAAHQPIIDRGQVRQTYGLDIMWLDLDAGHASVVTLARYYFGLFSHRRQDDLWKGMLEVNLADGTEQAAVAWLAAAAAPVVGGGP